MKITATQRKAIQINALQLSLVVTMAIAVAAVAARPVATFIYETVKEIRTAGDK